MSPPWTDRARPFPASAALVTFKCVHPGHRLQGGRCHPVTMTFSCIASSNNPSTKDGHLAGTNPREGRHPLSTEWVLVTITRRVKATQSAWRSAAPTEPGGWRGEGQGLFPSDDEIYHVSEDSMRVWMLPPTTSERQELQEKYLEGRRPRSLAREKNVYKQIRLSSYAFAFCCHTP